jgi:Mlc titration factor MtfA (ptsG expression regulator)
VFFTWFQHRRRRQLLELPVSSDWLDILHRNVVVFANLTSTEQAKLLDFIRIFIAEKNWEGCKGFSITDEVRVTIAAQAAMLVLGFEDEYFDRVTSILVYPDSYVAHERTLLSAGVIMEGPSYREGEAWYRGPIVLAWPEVLAGGRHEGSGNLVYHEFAHQLDMLNGSHADGVPLITSNEAADQWIRVMHAHYETLVHDCQKHGHSPIIDCYGATNKAEFFAVVTEAFFVRSVALRNRYPELYEMFRQWYRQDPATRTVRD